LQWQTIIGVSGTTVNYFDNECQHRRQSLAPAAFGGTWESFREDQDIGLRQVAIPSTSLGFSGAVA